MGLGSVTLLMVISIMMLTTQTGMALGFTSNVRADNGSSYSYDPAIAVNSSGVIFLVWSDYRNTANNDIYSSKSTNHGAFFIGDVRVDGSSGGDQLSPDIAIGNDDTIHVLWQDSRGSTDDIYYSNSTNSGSTFNTDKRVDDSSSGQQRSPAIAVYGTTIHAVWEDTRNGNYDIYYAKSSDNGDTWGTNVRVDNTGAGTSDQRYPDLITDSGGDIFVAWQDNRNGNFDIYFASSTNGGSSFNTNVRVDDTGSGTSSQEKPAIALDGSDNIHIAWQDSRTSGYDIYYCNSTTSGASFNADKRVDDSASGDQKEVAITVDVNNIVHVTWQDYRNSASPDIYHSNMTLSGTFNTNARVDDSSSGFQELPDIGTDSNANIYIVWEDDRNTDDDIYFSRNSNTQPSKPTLTGPSNNGWVTTNTPTFTWTFNDPDPTDTQSAYQLLVYSGAVTALDTGVVLSTTISHVVTTPIGDGVWDWKVKVRDSSGAWSYYSGPWVVKIDTSIPSASTPVDAGAWSTSSSITWTWTPSTDSPSGIDGYYVCVGTSSGTCDVVLDDWTGTAQYIYNGAGEGGTYFAKFKARDMAGNTGSYGGNSDGITVDTQAPGANVPSDAGQYTNSTSVTWTWTASTDGVSGVAGYYICVGSAAGACDVVDDAWMTEPNYTYHGAQNGQEYFAKTKAMDNATNMGSYSANSDGVTVDTIAPTTGRPVDDGDYISNTDVDFRWANSTDAISGIKGYYVSIGTLPGGNDILSNVFVSMSNYTYTNGQNGVTYYAIVRSVDNAPNIGQPSLSSDGVTVDLTAPGAPNVYDDGLSDSDDQAGATWETMEDLESGIKWYNVQLMDGPQVLKEVNTTLTSYTFSDTAPFLEHGKMYNFRVRALNGAGNYSDWGISSGFWVDTMINASMAGQHDGIYSNSTAIVWTWPPVVDSPAGIAGYHISIGTNPGTSDVLANVWTSTDKFTFTGGTNGAIYYITVTAVDNAGNTATPVANMTGVMVDTVSPRVSAVTDQGTFSPTLDLEFTWTGYPDVGSGIDLYYIAIGTSPYAEDVLVDMTYDTNYTYLGAETGKIYYAKVRAVDKAGNFGDWGVSTDGIQVDLTAPSDIELLEPDEFINTVSYLDLEWTESEDALSGIPYYKYSIGTIAGGTDIMDWTMVIDTSVRVDGLSLQEGKTYFISVKAVNGAGTESGTHFSEVTIDTKEPMAPATITYSEFSRSNAIEWTWSDALDDRAGIAGYYICIGTAQGQADIVDMVFVDEASFGYEFGIHETGYHITIIAVDKAGNMALSAMAGPLTVDIVPPKVMVVTRAGAYSYERAVNWSWEAEDPVSGIDGYQVMVLDQNTLPPSIVGSEMYVTKAMFALNEGLVEGHAYSIKVRPKDRAGNWGDIAYGETITIDTVPPTAVVRINNNATRTNSRAVTVQISTTHKDLTQMLISNVMDFTGSTWEPFSPSRLWYVTPGDGAKVVYVVIRDASGQQSPLYQVPIVLDTVQPKLDLDLPGDVVSTSSLVIKGQTEPGAEITINNEAVRVDSDGNFEKTVELKDGTNLITVVAKDSAGNEVKVTRAINRDAFYLPSSALLILILVLLVLTILGLAFGLSARRRLKDVTKAPKEDRSSGKRRPRGKRPRPATREISEMPRSEEEHEAATPDIISQIRSTEDSEAAQLQAASAPDADEIVLETDVGTVTQGSQDEVEFEEGTDDGDFDDEEEIEEELEVEDPPSKPLAHVRCNECSDIIPIYSRERPLKIQCPSCGKLGMIRK